MDAAGEMREESSLDAVTLACAWEVTRGMQHWPCDSFRSSAAT